MSVVYEKNFIYIESFDLDSEEIKSLIISKIKSYDSDIRYDIFINCVKNKNMEKLGYSYGWISDEKLFNVLVGFNPDGSERIEKKIIEKEDTKSTDYTEDWGTEAENTIYEEKYLGPLIDFKDVIKINEGFILRNQEKQNTLFTENSLAGEDLDKIKNFFKKFNMDKFQNRFPIVNVKKKNNKTFCTVKFSPRHPYLASFVLNLVKKINFNDNLYFFSQTKNRKYERR
jgi:hypothetical protein